jgi:hypothetical protein
MVARGHLDLVGRDEGVAQEYARGRVEVQFGWTNSARSFRVRP